MLSEDLRSVNLRLERYMYVCAECDLLMILIDMRCVTTCPSAGARKGQHQGPRVRLPLKENAWSHHQCLFEENIEKTKKMIVCAFWKWEFRSCLCIGKVLAPHVPITRGSILQPSVQNMTSKWYISLFYVFYLLGSTAAGLLLYVSSIAMRNSDLCSSLRIEHWLNCFYLFWKIDFNRTKFV